MSRTLTPLKGTAGVTYCTLDGTPYRTDVNGIIYVLSNAHSTELIANTTLTAASAAYLAAHGHRGEGVVTNGNVVEHG